MKSTNFYYYVIRAKKVIKCDKFSQVQKIKDDMAREFRAELIFMAQEAQERKLDISQIEGCLRYADNYEDMPIIKCN